MATSKTLHKIVGDVTECPICTEVIVDSKILPCIHTFCLKCLEQFWKDKKPGDQVPCPLCRTTFSIPAGGLSNLPKNCFVEKLLDAQISSMADQSFQTCDVCLQLKKHGDELPTTAEKYCVDCESHMCEQCAKIHLIMKSSKMHRIVVLDDSASPESTNQTLKTCNEHRNKQIEIYCLECEIAVCTTCFMIGHNGHKWTDINEACEDLKNRIRIDMAVTDRLLLDVNNQSGILDRVMNEFEFDIYKTESQIVKKGEEIKHLVEIHVQNLLQELKKEKITKFKEFENFKEDFLVQKVSLESFMKYLQSVLDKAIPTDVVCLAAELRTRANDLSKMRIVPVEKQVKISFVPSDLSMFTVARNARSFVGKTSFSGIAITNFFLEHTSSAIRRTRTEKIIIASNKSSPIGITISDEEIFIVYSERPEIQVLDCETFKQLRTISVPTLKDPWDITYSENILFVGEYEWGRIHRIPLNSSERTRSWVVNDRYLALSTMKSGNILVTCYSKDRLTEYTTTGQLVRAIGLRGISKPLHAIQLENDKFLVCHEGLLNRVCLIDNDGQLIKSYGGSQGSEKGQLTNPSHLFADVNGFCLVVERGGAHRVILLDRELEFVKELIPQSSGLESPMRLCLDRRRKQLLVADYLNSQYVVFDLLP